MGPGDAVEADPGSRERPKPDKSGQKRSTKRRRKRRADHHLTYVFTAVEVWSRLWVSLLVGNRNWRNTRLHFRDLRDRWTPSAVPTLLTTDSYVYYTPAVAKTFDRSIVYAQVDKVFRRGKVFRSDDRLVIGTEHRLERAQARSEDSKKINTSYVERLNLTIRRSLAALQRKSTSYPRSEARLLEMLELLRAYYNFVRPHLSLRFGREYRTPGMQAGLVSRRLSLREIFLSCLPAPGARQLAASWAMGGMGPGGPWGLDRIAVGRGS